MNVYLASPNTQQQAEHACGMPVLLSYAIAGKSRWIEDYATTFSRILIDSGAYSVLKSHIGLDVKKYAEWAERWVGHADAIAGLDDISGDWKKSLANYESFSGGFPTFHNTDPPELLDDLVAMAIERKQWIGLGIKPPREGYETWIRESCERIPDQIHIHGWALRLYTYIRRLDSVDSTNWWRDAMQVRTIPQLAHLTYGECLEIIVKRYQRWERSTRERGEARPLFESFQ